MPISLENKQSRSLLVLALATGMLWSRQLSQQAIHLGSDTAKEKKEKGAFFFTKSTRVCVVMSWGSRTMQLGRGWQSSSAPSGAPAGSGRAAAWCKCLWEVTLCPAVRTTCIGTDASSGFPMPYPLTLAPVPPSTSVTAVRTARGRQIQELMQGKNSPFFCHIYPCILTWLGSAS